MFKVSYLGLLAAVVAAVGWAGQARAVDYAGTDLSGLKYSPNGGDALYVAGTPDVAHLYTSDSGPTGGAPAVYVQGPLGPLNSLSASYNLLSSSGPYQPYWLTYLIAPAPGTGYIGVVGGGPDLNGSSQIHVFYDYAPGALTSDTYSGYTLSQLDSTVYGSTTFGQMTVYETGVEIGNNGANGIPASADIQSISVVPEPASLSLLALGATGLLLRRRKA